MKVKIGPHRSWVGPYQIASALFLWPQETYARLGEPVKPESWRVTMAHRFGHWVAEDKSGNNSWLTKFCLWLEQKRQRQVYVRIDKYDSWNADHTLAYIIHPLMIQLRDTKHGFGLIDDEDVPESLRSVHATVQDNQGAWDNLAEARYTWVLNEIIWAFGCYLEEDDQAPFYTHPEPGEVKLSLQEHVKLIKVDEQGLLAHNKRKANAFKLFGKYYQTFWD